MNTFKDTVKDIVYNILLFCFYFHAESFGPEEQYFSGVYNYLLLTMFQVYHCIISVSFSL